MNVRGLLPSEHGGWGLTLEPVLLGLLVAWSGAGAAIGAAAFLVFLLRTPLKLAVIDVRRHQWQERSRTAALVASVEAVLVLVLVVVAGRSAGWAWLVPVAVAAPLAAVEWSFDVRSRGRRLVPELCGAVGVAASAAAIAVAGGETGRFAAGLWLVLAARSVGAIPFVRAQIMRLRRGEGPVRQSDGAQVLAIGVAALAAALDSRLMAGLAAVVALSVVQVVWVRRAPVAAKVLGMRQMALGLLLVAITAIGAW